MKLTKKDISAKDGSGTVGLKPETPEDLWHAYNLLQTGDLVRCTTIRKVMKETSTIGLRKSNVDKVSLDRRTETVEVLGHPVRVKLAFFGDRLTNVQPAWEDVAAIAAATGEPAKDILAKATSVASHTWN